MRGVLGHFKELDSAVEAITELRQAKLGDVTVFMPTPRHEIESALQSPPSPVRLYLLVGGLAGCLLGYWIAIWPSNYWPLVVGGKAISSWIPYTIFAFEVFVLFGALSTVAGLFIHARIPRITMTVGYDPRFSYGDFGIWVECEPAKFASAKALLEKHGAVEVRGER